VACGVERRPAIQRRPGPDIDREGKLLAISDYLLAPQGLVEDYGDRSFVIFGDRVVKKEDYLI